MQREIMRHLENIGEAFSKVMYESDKLLVASLLLKGRRMEDIRRIQFFDWFQGVGIYGYYSLYKSTGNTSYKEIIKTYLNERIRDGLPDKNINSMAPMLTMLLIGQEEKNSVYLTLADEWATWLYESMPRTEEGCFAHKTCESANEGELWDDTLFMSVLFLAKAGLVFDRPPYIEDAAMQFFGHHKYLGDDNTGFWYHGWTFKGRHNFANALWCRGNSWITMFVPIFLEMLDTYPLEERRQSIIEIYNQQVRGLLRVQDASGLWPTLLNEPDTYMEASGTCGIGFGLLRGLELGIVDEELVPAVKRSCLAALRGILPLITDGGFMEQVSAGTAMGKELSYYRQIPIKPKPYGQAMAILFLLECHKWQSGE